MTTKRTTKLEDIKTGLDQLTGMVQEGLPENYDPKKTADMTRSSIAKWFVLGHLLSLPLVVILCMAFNILMVNSSHGNNVIELEKIVPLITGFIGSPVGFVLGYYFKSEENRN